MFVRKVSKIAECYENLKGSDIADDGILRGVVVRPIDPVDTKRDSGE